MVIFLKNNTPNLIKLFYKKVQVFFQVLEKEI